MNKYNVEYTDTFAGQANYCWVKRATIEMPSLTPDKDINRHKAEKAYDRELMRRAKAEMGLTGVRGKVSNWGDTIEFRPYGAATVMFVSWSDD